MKTPLEVLGYGFGGRIKVSKDDNGNLLLNERVPVEDLEEVVTLLYEFAEKISQTEYYKKVYSVKTQAVDPVCLTCFNVSNTANWLKEWQDRLSE